MAGKEDKAHEILLGNIRKLLRDRAGREVIWHILSLCEIYSPSFTGNSHTFFNEGKRTVGLEIIDLLNQADPSAYANLLLKQGEKDA